MEEIGMMTSEDRVAKGAMWLEQLRGWQDSGESLVSYARRRGFDAEAAYRWRRILRRSGQWTGAQAERKVVNTAARAAAKFARVALSDGARAASMLLRLSLSNGRRAELELADISQLGEVLRLIERAA
jgi:transposase-like protein